MYLAGCVAATAPDAAAAPTPSLTNVLCAAGAEAHFLPETNQLYVPVACSAEEFNQRMDAALA